MNKFLIMLEWKKQIPVIAIFALSAIACAFSVSQHLSLSKTMTFNQERLAYIKNRTSDAIKNREIISTYKERFNLLKQRGYIGEPQRLQWLESLQSTVDELSIPQVKFTLAPTVPAEPKVDAGGYSQTDSNLLITPMLLEMELMHGRDLYDFFNRYKQAATGVFQIDSCEIKRLEKNTASDKPVRLLTSCQLTWLNFRDIREDWEPAS